MPRPLLSQWKNGGRQVPAERCPQIERATGGAVRCEELRPDVAWDVLRMQAIEPAAVTNPDRRVSTEPNPFPDLDRRAAVQGA